MKRLITSTCLILAFIVAVQAQEPGTKKPDEKKPAAKTAVPDQATLEKEFAQSLTGVVLVGRYTIDRPNGKPDEAEKADSKPREDRYTIQQVSKISGDLWLFQARVQYGERDVTVPIPLAVKWAGDTPVITLTDAAIPGLGTYTARVMIYRGQYAGTWSGGDHGGHMWGRIEKLPTAPESPRP
jgi:hypothetical protein